MWIARQLILFLFAVSCLGQQVNFTGNANLVGNVNINTSLIPMDVYNSTNVVQYANGNGTAGNQGLGGAYSNNVVMYIHPFNKTQTANTFLVLYSWQTNNSSLGVGDDKTETYRLATAKAGSTRLGMVWMATNGLANVTNIWTTNTTGGRTWYAKPDFLEICHVPAFSPIDLLVTNTGTGNDITTGSFTPSAPNELAITYIIWDGGSSQPPLINTTNQNGVYLCKLGNDPQDGDAVFAGVVPGTPTVNFHFTCSYDRASASGTVAWIALTVVFKSAPTTGSGYLGLQNGGPTPGTMTVLSVQNYSVPGVGLLAQGNGAAVWFPAMSNTFPVPMYGNFGLMEFTGDYLFAPTNTLTDTCGNTWTQTGTTPNPPSSDEAVDWAFIFNPITSGTNQLPLMYLQTNHDATVTFFDVSGGNTGTNNPGSPTPPYIREWGTGTQTVAGNITTGALTPNAPNGIIWNAALWQDNTGLYEVSGKQMDYFTYGDIPINGPANFFENNAASHTNITSLTALSFTYQLLSGSVVANNYAWDSIHFSTGGNITPPNPVGVQFDSTFEKGVSGAGQSGLSFVSNAGTVSGSVANNTNRLLVAYLAARGISANLQAPSCTWNGVSMKLNIVTNYTLGSTLYGEAMFTLVAPATGAQTISATFNNGITSTDTALGAVSLWRVDQVSPVWNFIWITNNSTMASNTVATTPGNMIVGGHTDDNGSSSHIIVGTQAWMETSLNGNYGMAYSVAQPSWGNPWINTNAWSWTGAKGWLNIGLDVRQTP